MTPTPSPTGVLLWDAWTGTRRRLPHSTGLELRPDHPDTLTNRGVALGDLGRHEEALAALDRSLELRPDPPGTHYNRGVALGRLDRHEEALAAYDRSLELRPDDPRTHYNRGVVLGRLGRHEEALAAFDRSLELRPDDPARTTTGGASWHSLVVGMTRFRHSGALSIWGGLMSSLPAATRTSRYCAMTPDSPNSSIAAT